MLSSVLHISLLKLKLVKFPSVSSPVVSSTTGCWYILNYFNGSRPSAFFLCYIVLELMESWVKPWLKLSGYAPGMQQSDSRQAGASSLPCLLPFTLCSVRLKSPMGSGRGMAPCARPRFPFSPEKDASRSPQRKPSVLARLRLLRTSAEALRRGWLGT